MLSHQGVTPSSTYLLETSGLSTVEVSSCSMSFLLATSRRPLDLTLDIETFFSHERFKDDTLKVKQTQYMFHILPRMFLDRLRLIFVNSNDRFQQFVRNRLCHYGAIYLSNPKPWLEDVCAGSPIDVRFAQMPRVFARSSWDEDIRYAVYYLYLRHFNSKTVHIVGSLGS